MNVKPLSVQSTTRQVSKNLSTDYDLCDEDQKSRVISAPPPSPQNALIGSVSVDDLQKEADLIRKLYLSSRGERSNTGWLKHNYIASNANQPIAGTPIFTTLNAIAAGSAANTRLGTSITMHSCTLRFQAQYGPTATASLAAINPSQFRVIVFRNKVPASIPATYASTYTNSSTVPIIGEGTLFSTLAVGEVMAVRNPNTFDQYHILHDKIHNIPYAALDFSSTSGAIAGSMAFDEYIDFHKANTQFFDTGANDIVTNSLTICVCSTTLAGNGATLFVSFTADTVFSDANVE